MDNDVYITTKEALQCLKVSKMTLYKLVRDNKIKAHKANQRVIYYSLKSIKEYMSGVKIA